MASAAHRTESVIDLTISEDEALALYAVLMRTGGPAETTERGNTASVLSALRSALPRVPHYSVIAEITGPDALRFTGKFPEDFDTRRDYSC